MTNTRKTFWIDTQQVSHYWGNGRNGEQPYKTTYRWCVRDSRHSGHPVLKTFRGPFARTRAMRLANTMNRAEGLS